MREKYLSEEQEIQRCDSSSAGCTLTSFRTKALVSVIYLFVEAAAKLIGEGRSSSSHSQLRCLTANHYMKGLLEVQPLHFTCHATSDGTKLEKMDSGGAGGPLINYFEAPPISPISPILTNQVASNGPKKIVENDIPESLETSEPESALVVYYTQRFPHTNKTTPAITTSMFETRSIRLADSLEA
ncbi:Baculoviral IAP repeat-containing protein 6 [Homalodisca vitripennis]|nr:Baculoviral IAP repeat-containing protein 6 [Homalodisca vitripennis]